MGLWTCGLLLCAVVVCITEGRQLPGDEDWLELDTPQGPVRGRRDPNANHLYAFYNIPYATAPVGENKYKPPLPAPRWTERFDAINRHIVCPQASMPDMVLDGQVLEQEDCLVANVFVPDTQEKNLPVYVVVHGGAFVIGYGAIVSSSRLLENKDIILVNFNYRLGIHGFLCLGTDDVPGNAGMKDQVAALRWVQENIASYGGNPNDVTLGGYSAGSASVDLLMLSKSAEGLFHRVIPESGGNLAAFSVQRDPIESAKYQARKLGFNNVGDISALEEFYKTASLEKLTSDAFMERPDSTFLFGPCVERETDSEAFLTESPLSILQKGSYKKLPILYGFANMEGLFRMNLHNEWKEKMNEKFSDFLPADLTFESEAKKEEVANKIKKFFFDDKSVSTDNVLSYIEYFTDVLFAYPMLWAVKKYVEAGNNEIYLYEYSFVDENTPLVPNTNVKGADHCAQTMAVVDGDESGESIEMQTMRKNIREIWRNFIKTGKPSSEWQPARADRSPYMDLGVKIELKNEPLLGRRNELWDDIYSKHYLDSVPPSTPPSGEDWLELDTPQGPVRGHKDPDADLYVFYNIPYATAPVGVNKYRPPLPAPKWTEPFKATNRHIVCPQPSFPGVEVDETLVEQEDCLVANIYVPNTEEKNLTVYVVVHGGAFIMGYGSMLTANRLLENKDMILVNFNYRLGIHGFLCLGTEDIPGNAGMKDQVAALRWVQENIASYGGNPNDVTLGGFSAGSASVDLLMLSKSAEGLFHRVIPESGGNLAAFSVQRDPIESAKYQARKLGFNNVEDISALEEFYKTASLEAITSDTFIDRPDSTFLFGPCVERETESEAFLTESPLSILQKGSYKKLPILYGFANMEGLFRMNLHNEWKEKMNEKFSDFLPADLTFESEAKKEEVANKIKKFFFDDKSVSTDNVLSYIDYFTDVLFAYPMLWAVKKYVEAGNNEIYLYEYSFVDENTPLVPNTNVKGADHCAQTMAVVDGDESGESIEMQTMRKNIREIWRNFIKTGKPSSEWQPARADRSPYMDLGVKIELKNEPLLGLRNELWDDIYSKHYLDSVPPSTPPSGEDWLELDTPQGPVRGRKDPDADLYVFYNIPYATAPVGVNKYRPPLPAPKWTEPFKATNRHIVCPQPSFPGVEVDETLVEQEDCLVANIYVPNTEEKNLTVYVVVHGGAFIMGYGSMLTANRLLENKDMILVNFNYRLGIHGFLCLGTEDIPGNAGMKDQVAALRWVQENIASYGGNPNDVTLGGFSAGSASVDLLMLSKSAEGLFHRVIPESGGNLAAFSVQRDPIESAKYQARKLGFNNVEDISALEEFYKTASLEAITSDTFIDRPDSTFLFGPCVERETESEAFLTESPLSILQKGSYKKLPILYGFANMEGLFRMNFFNDWKTQMNEKFSDFLPADLTFESEAQKEEVANKIKEFFFEDKPISTDNALGYVDYFTDVIFAYPMLWAVKYYVEAGNNEIYLYEYSFVDERTPVVHGLQGAEHCAQSFAVQDGDNESEETIEMQNMRRTIRGYWRNFIKTGNPSSAWQPAGADRSPYMNLGVEVELKNEPLLGHRNELWDDIYSKHYRDSVPPKITNDA
ncbi:uncharacterized protein LOC113492805 [Trichoplusia ni]|uniref:Uncharacterized protein LOC113492805 n=1 Tax=Trichoplusia ni TaxID=7111 RepID=A0A7E5VDA7_TRINI|nr:uncharacterized protein LOC113492805 [Trichoplusia ni]